jgi:hypothetical protein
MPLKNTKITPSLSVGFVWENKVKYSGPLKRTKSVDNFQIFLKPNIEF